MKVLTLPDFLNSHPIATLSLDDNMTIVYDANEAARELLGYKNRPVSDLEISTLIPTWQVKRNASQLARIRTPHSGDVILKIDVKSFQYEDKKFNLAFLIPTSNVPFTDSPYQPGSSLEKIIVNNLGEIFLIPQNGLSVLYANGAALTNLGYTVDNLKGLKITDLFSFPDEMALNALLNTLRTDGTERLDLQLKFTRKDGSHYDAEVLIQLIKDEEVFLFIASDISSKLLTERKLLDSIREKDNLIKEIHHRVKNNLQLISSIIYLKLVSLGESEMKSFLEDTRQKIRSIALIHERLLQTEKLDRVDIADYLGKLIHDLEITYHRPGLDLEMKTELESRMIGLDTAIICGLIVNELVTNALKHAFSDQNLGVITIGFYENADSTCSLTVADNGKTLPANVEPGQSSSFGMQLLHVFVRQLNGKMEIDREKGTKFRLTF